MNPKNFWCKIEHLPFDFTPKIVFLSTGEAFDSNYDKYDCSFVACYITGFSTLWAIDTNPARTSNQDPNFFNSILNINNGISWYTTKDSLAERV